MFAYQLLRGCAGASGHIRAAEGRRQVTVRGLPPGTECAFYVISGGRGVLCGQARADHAGQAEFSVAQPGTLLIAREGRLILWEEGEDGQRSEMLARTCLMALKEAAAGQSRKAETPSSTPEEKEAQLIPPEALRPARETENRAEKEEKASPSAGDGAPALRPPGKGEAVDALPALRWPASVESLKTFFDTCPPIALFRAPGWRFVRVPSPVQGAAYCAVGYFARDSRVTQVSYAIPGTPYRPPIPGYRFEIGLNGQGYWTLWRSVAEPRRDGSPSRTQPEADRM